MEEEDEEKDWGVCVGRLYGHQLGQVLDLVCLGRREEHGLALARQQLHDLVHLFFESNLEDAVSLVDDQAEKVVELETLGVLQKCRAAGTEQL